MMMIDDPGNEWLATPSEQHFLLVDDDPESRSIVTEYLKSLGYSKITQAQDGSDALRKLEKDNSITFIISDWDMPLMDGHTFLQRVKFNPARANIPFLIITSPVSKEAEKVILAAESMVDGYLIKPFRSQLLKDKIDEVLSVAIRGPQKKVVVIDDNAEARETVVDYLKKMGFKDVVDFQEPKLAIELFSRIPEQIGMIISDWEMPEITGVELLSFARAHPILKSVPFLMVTSQSSIERMKVMQAAQQRVDEYLLKPFGVDEMRRRVETLIERSRSYSRIKTILEGATVALDASKWPRAEELFQEVLAIDPENDVALRGLGDAVTKLKGVQSALPFYRRAVEASPVNPAGYQRLAVAYEQVGWVDKAIALLETANRQISFNADLHFRLGQLYMKKDLEERALQEFEKTLSIQLDHQQARVMMDMLYARRRS